MDEPSGSSWREAALDLADILAEDDEVESVFEAGVRVGRFSAALLWPLDRQAAVEEGRRAGLAEGFAQGVAFAERQSQERPGQQEEKEPGDLPPRPSARERPDREAEAC